VQQPKGVSERIWRVLNSAFILWLLSTGAVWLISRAYASWEESTGTRELVRRLDLEIGSRIRMFDGALGNVKTADQFYTLLVFFDRPYRAPIFPEFEDRSLRSLVWELQSLVPESERPTIRNAFRSIQQIVDISTGGIDNSEALKKKPVPKDEWQRVSRVLQSLKINRWNLL
jgi:hypothetical protein